ncbi:MAG TPA: glycosyltransferase [Steroidobacteraceae bacterium]
MMLLKLLTAMGSSPFRPVVISLGNCGTVGTRIEELGVPVHALNLRGGSPSPRGLWQLRSLLHHVQPGLIQGWMYHGNLAASVARLFSGIRAPVLWNIRATPDDLLHGKASTAAVIRAGAILSRLPQRIIYNSRRGAVQHAAIGYFTPRSLVIPNGFDCEIFKPSQEARLQLRQELGLRADSILVGLIARFHPMKDHATFFQAAALLNARHPNVHYVLAGHRMELENAAIQAMLQASHVTDKVHLLGERHDMPAINAALDIASLSSSSSEGFPNVIGEAMASGVPSVVTDVGDAAWLVGDIGRIVQPGDPAALAAAWSDLINIGPDARRAMGARCRARVLSEFTLNRVANKYADLYGELLIGRNG